MSSKVPSAENIVELAGCVLSGALCGCFHPEKQVLRNYANIYFSQPNTAAMGPSKREIHGG